MLGLTALSAALPVKLPVKLPDVAAPRDHPAGRIVDLPGRGSTYVVDTGPARGRRNGPTFLMLHAVGCTGMLTWYPSLETMARFGRVVIFDQRGHGAGIVPSRVLLEDCADDAVALADALGIDTFIPVGFSMGSLVAQLVWQRHRNRVEGLVLCAGAATFAEATLRRVGTTLFAALLDAFSPQLGAPAVPVTPEPGTDPAHPYAWAFGEFRSTSPGGLLRSVAEIVRFDSRPWLAQIDVPTSVVIPSRDKFIAPRHQHWMAAQIPGAHAVTVDAGHSCCTLGHEAFVPGLATAVESVLARSAQRARKQRRAAAG